MLSLSSSASPLFTLNEMRKIVFLQVHSSMNFQLCLFKFLRSVVSMEILILNISSLSSQPFFITDKSFSHLSSHKSLFKNPSASWKQSRRAMIRIEQFSCWRCQQLHSEDIECYWKFMSKWNLRLIALKLDMYKKIMMMRLSQLHKQKFYFFLNFLMIVDVFTNYHNLTWLWRFFRNSVFIHAMMFIG